LGIPMPGKGVVAKGLSTGLFNTGQNAAAEAAISGIADTKQIKEAHDPLDLDKALVSFVSGGVAGGAAKAIGNMKESRANKANADFDQRLKTAVEAKASVTPEVKTGIEVPDLSIESPTRAAMRVAEQNKSGLPKADDFNNRDANVRAVEEEIAANEARQAADAQMALDAEVAKGQEFLKAQQMEIDDHPFGDRPAQYGFTDTGGRVDESVPGMERDALGQMRVTSGTGIPIRADLSMEAQNLQDPLQRNLWGDELPPKAEQELANAPGLRMPRNQRGALDFGSNKDKQDVIGKIVGQKHFTPIPLAEDIATAAMAEGADGKGINTLEAGGSLAGAKRNSALITGVSRIVQHYKNVSEDGIRSSVFPTETRLRALSGNELVQLGKVMKAEMFAKAQLSPTELADLGLSVKQPHRLEQAHVA